MVDGGFSHDRRPTPRSRTWPNRGPHLRPPGTRLPAHPPAPTPLPHRDRGTDQPPQARLRTAPQPPQRRRRPPDLGRLGDVHLQRRHLHHPPVKHHPRTEKSGAEPEGSKAQERPSSQTAPQRRPHSSPINVSPSVYPGEVVRLAGRDLQTGRLPPLPVRRRLPSGRRWRRAGHDHRADPDIRA